MLTRINTHRHLSDAARQLRSNRPGMSYSDAFQLSCIRSPELSRLLAADLDLRASRGHKPDRHDTNRKADELGQAVRDWVKGSDGKTDPAKLKRLAEANDCWQAKYDGMNLGSQSAAVLGKLRWLGGQGHRLVFSE